MTEVKKDYHPIQIIIADLGVYKEPNIIKPEFSGLINVKSADIKGIDKYLPILLSIKYAWQKILKYEAYFAKLYTSDKSIEDFEALNHHIHAYLQDMDTLKNKIEVLLGTLKNDLRKIASNKEDIDDFLNAAIEKNTEVFSNVLKHRHPHVHAGMRFMDDDLLKAENACSALEMFSNPIFDAILNQELKPELVARLEKEKEESFEVAKNRWIKTARDNNKQVSEYLNFMMEAIRPSLYQFLNIRPINDILSDAKSNR
ncbi:MAG: hypothetical protein PHH27_01855 [Candidatus Colwellbacteria bacterium]|nr:hypothetical protein [Candidatus Colwellbacteria bacterium]